MTVWLPVAIVVCVFMDVWAGLLHGLAWHRWLWPVHRSHHVPREGRFEANDALAVLHAPIAMALILWGCVAAPSVLREVAFGVGIGMTAFAIGYIIVHDGLVHGRLPVAALERLRFLRGIARAHRAHHKGEHRAPYSLFFGPTELRLLKRHRRAPHGAPSAPTATRAEGRARA